MSQNLKNKIEAKDTSINLLLKEQKFTIDYFQREYRWQEKHIKLMIEDLTTTFLKSYNHEHKRSDVSNYQSYYLGPVVFSVNPETGRKSIIDGQQRITSITLFLIFLNHLQKNNDQNVSISELIFSEKFGEKSFNMSDDAREECLKALFETGVYKVRDDDDETIHNIIERYNNIEESFPEELTGKPLPFFIDWLKENVVIVEIKAYSDDNAYIIFETMNDRGLNLTNTEMLKGFVLSKIDKKHRVEMNALWKELIQKLHEYDENADLSFFQAWFRGKYAVSIRPGKVDSVDQDYELIGTRFHSWFKDNHRPLFNLNSSDDFYNFFKIQFPFYVKWYLKIWEAQNEYNKSMPHLKYIQTWGIAESLQDPMLLASINFTDNEDTIQKKIDFVSRYIETFTVRRAINSRKFGQTSIKYTMFNIIKLIRNNDIQLLGTNLTNEINSIDLKWNGIDNFVLNSQNYRFAKHFLSRITSYLDFLVGKDTSYITYYQPDGKQFEIEHIWANKFRQHRDEFDQEGVFLSWRGSIGALLLLPQGTNQSFSSDKYEDKLEHYLKENTYAQTLHPAYYKKNPNFLNSEIIQGFDFKSHAQFKIADISERIDVLIRICEKLYSVEYFNNN
jgi:uncharacterized protein with ParB-like and HNH nuclease domain